MRKAVLGLAKSEEQAERIINHLTQEGLNSECATYKTNDQPRFNRIHTSGDFSRTTDVELPVKNGRRALAHEKHTKAPEGGVTGAAAGGIIGGSVGLLAGLGTIAIPGLGPFIAAGPLLAALSGSGIGGGIGLILGSALGATMPEYEATVKEDASNAGILLSVESENSEDLARAEEIMKAEGAEDISTVRES